MSAPYEEIQFTTDYEPGPVSPRDVAIDDQEQAVADTAVPAEAGAARRGAGAIVGAPGRAVRWGARTAWNAIPPRQRRNQVPWNERRLPVPQWMTDRRVVVASWVVALILIGVDEHRYGYALPRPARLWGASGVYLILAAAGSVEDLTPIVNALAIGYVMILAYQYFNGEGMFAATTKGQTAPSGGKTAGPAPAAGSGTAGG